MQPNAANPAREAKNGPWDFGLAFFPAVFPVLALMSYPLLLNADFFLNSDEAFNANEIINWLEGGPFFFYYEGERYHGILEGISAIPFFRVFGATALAYKLPSLVYYGLYVCTTGAALGAFNPTAGWLAMALMLFPSPAVLHLATNNTPHVLICFLGNLIFLLFIKIKQRENTPGGPPQTLLFCLFAAIGLGIYAYNLSILHIFSIGFLYVLSHPEWSAIRSRLVFSALREWLTPHGDAKLAALRLLDIVIAAFFLAVVFGYVWGGFEFDIAGVSILQIHKPHRAMLQFLALLALRLAIRRNDLKPFLQNALTFARSMESRTKSSLRLAATGFLLGISPRILSVLIGETQSGGQGFSINIPGKIPHNIWMFMTNTLPDILGLREPMLKIALAAKTETAVFGGIYFTGALLATLFLYLGSAWHFLSAKPAELKAMFRVRPLPFNPASIFLIFPAAICAAVVVSSNNPATRFLIPLYGVIMVWTAVCLDKILEKSWFVFAVLLSAYCGYNVANVYGYYSEQQTITGYSVARKPEPLFDVIDFMKSENLEMAYADYWVAHKATFLSRRKIFFNENTKSPRGKKQKARFAATADFAIVLRENNKLEMETYLRHLQQKHIQSREKSIGPYRVMWGFEGNKADVDALRSLFD